METVIPKVKHSDRSELTVQAEELHASMKSGENILFENMTLKERQQLSVRLGRASGTDGATKGMYSFRKEGTGFRIYKNRDK